MVKTRFAPSPTGHLHIGGARTALFNWLFARKHGGRFVLRIEDTDIERNVPGAERQIADDLAWLGLDPDESPWTGGPDGPYRQSERLEHYAHHARRLLDAGHAYYCFDTPAELAAQREAAKRQSQTFRYRRPAVLPSHADAERARSEGRPVVVRMKAPQQDVVVEDRILGAVTIRAEEMEDFIIVKSNGYPTYHFAVVIDDELMHVTHVIRAQEHLMNTPKHMALQDALGFRRPVYAHVPIVMNMDGSKMSKRDKEVDIAAGRPPREIDVHDFRRSGYLPEAVVNFIALLGWSPGEDRERMSLDEMIALFDLERVGRTSARFDREKLLAFNTDAAARAAAARLRAAFRDYAGLVGSAMAALDDATLDRALAACKGLRTLADVPLKVGPLYAADADLQYDPQAVRKVLAKDGGRGYAALAEVLHVLDGLGTWSAESVDAAIKSFCESRGLKLGDVAQPLRVALTGQTISPPIAETLDLLGREKTLRRVRACLAAAAAT